MLKIALIGLGILVAIPVLFFLFWLVVGFINKDVMKL